MRTATTAQYPGLIENYSFVNIYLTDPRGTRQTLSAAADRGFRSLITAAIAIDCRTVKARQFTLLWRIPCPRAHSHAGIRDSMKPASVAAAADRSLCSAAPSPMHRVILLARRPAIVFQNVLYSFDAGFAQQIPERPKFVIGPKLPLLLVRSCDWFPHCNDPNTAGLGRFSRC